MVAGGFGALRCGVRPAGLCAVRCRTSSRGWSCCAEGSPARRTRRCRLPSPCESPGWFLLFCRSGSTNWRCFPVEPRGQNEGYAHRGSAPFHQLLSAVCYCFTLPNYDCCCSTTHSNLQVKQEICQTTESFKKCCFMVTWYGCWLCCNWS